MAKGTPTYRLTLLWILDGSLAYAVRSLRHQAYREAQGAFVLGIRALTLVGGAAYVSLFFHPMNLLIARDLFPRGNSSALAAPLDRVGAIKLSPVDSDTLSNMISHIRKFRTNSDSTVYLFIDEPLFYFLADVVNPTRFAIPMWIIGSMNNEVIQDLREKKPVCIVAEVGQKGVSHSYFNGKVADFIDTHYTVVDRWGRYLFLTPKSANS